MPEVKLNNVRLSYAHLDKPVSYDPTNGFQEDNEAGVYSAVLIIEKGSEAEAALNKAVEEAKGEALASGIKGAGGKLIKITTKDMPRYNDGIRDGDTKDDDTYADSVYINAKAKLAYKPAVYDKANNRIENTKLYSGCYVNVYLRVYNYSAATNMGCGFGLVALQFRADGEPLGSTTDTDSIFGEKKETATTDTDSMFD